jgi:hypothetical protein
MHSTVPAQIGKVVFIHLEPGEDVLLSMIEVIEREQLQSGLILTVTGAVSEGGLSEIQGGGYFGWNADDWRNDKSQIRHDKGRPHIHCHVAVANAGTSHVGHLIEGCKVRSVHPISHFVAILAETPGVELTMHCSEETNEQYPYGIPYYNVAPASVPPQPA